MFKTKRSKAIVTIVAVIALVAILTATLVGCNIIPTANAASENPAMPRAGISNTIKYLFRLNSNNSAREYNGSVQDLKNACEDNYIDTNLIGVQVPSILAKPADGEDVSPDTKFTYVTVLFEAGAQTIFEYFNAYTNRYAHGIVSLGEINRDSGTVTVLTVSCFTEGLDAEGNPIPSTSVGYMPGPLVIYSE